MSLNAAWVSRVMCADPSRRRRRAGRGIARMSCAKSSAPRAHGVFGRAQGGGSGIGGASGSGGSVACAAELEDEQPRGGAVDCAVPMPRSICAAPPPQPALTAMYCSPVDHEGDRPRDGRALHRHFPQLLAVGGAEDRERLARGAFDHEIARGREHAAVAVPGQRHPPCFCCFTGSHASSQAFSRGSPSFCSAMRFFERSRRCSRPSRRSSGTSSARSSASRRVDEPVLVGGEVGELRVRAVRHREPVVPAARAGRDQHRIRCRSASRC